MILKVKEFFSNFGISLKNKRLCVCFSGGADSVGLSLAMLDLRKEIEFYLCAVHVNHHIRGDEADRDENFCVEFCKEMNIPLFVKHVFAKDESKKRGESLETVARNLRYDVFSSLKAEENIDFFLTAHHENDNAETIVFNLLRGTGVSGIVGIPPLRDFYLRPLLKCRKSEIVSFVKEKNASFVEDGTNNDSSYTRNYIRNCLFPQFERVNENFLSAITRLSQSASLDEDYFNSKVDEICENTDLSLLHPAVSARYICKKFEELSKGEGLSFLQVKQILSLLSSEEEKYVSLPFEIKAIIRKGRVLFLKSKEDLKEEVILQRGENPFFESFILLEERYEKFPPFADFPFGVILQKGKIKGNLFARKRQSGDKIFCRGMQRNVNKELCNRKIPKYKRDIVPVICDDEGVVFVPFVGADDRVYFNGDSQNPVRLEVVFEGGFVDNLF